MSHLLGNPADMTSRDVAKWVGTLGGSASRFTDLFLQHDIDGMHLIQMSDVQLKDLGVRNGMLRRKIVRATAALKETLMSFEMTGLETEAFDIIQCLQEWTPFIYFFNDYIDVAGLIVAYSGVEIPFPGSSFDTNHRKGEVGNYYKVKEQIGSGAFAVVRKIYDNKGTTFAAKIMDKSKMKKRVLKSVRKEIDILKVCDHQNVVTFIEYFETRSRLTLVLEYLAGKNLLQRLIDCNGFAEAHAKIYFRQMVDAVEFLHSRDIVHRDIKLDNFLLSAHSNEATIVLADFGLAHRMRRDEILNHPCGTLGYTAPEVVLGGYYGLSCDVWSLGVCLYILLCGYPPFDASTNQNDLRNQICDGNWHMDGNTWKKISEEAKDLVRTVLEFDPDIRQPPHVIRNHIWLSDGSRTPERKHRSRLSINLTSDFFNMDTKDVLRTQ